MYALVTRYPEHTLGETVSLAGKLTAPPTFSGFDYAAASLAKADPFHIERMNATAGKIIIDGNAAAALGCMFGGVSVVTSRSRSGLIHSSKTGTIARLPCIHTP